MWMDVERVNVEKTNVETTGVEPANANMLNNGLGGCSIARMTTRSHLLSLTLEGEEGRKVDGGA